MDDTAIQLAAFQFDCHSYPGCARMLGGKCSEKGPFQFIYIYTHVYIYIYMFYHVLHIDRIFLSSSLNSTYAGRSVARS